MARDFQPLDDETYERLRRLARKLHGARGGFEATLQPTALLHEAWMKISRTNHHYECKEHFQAVAARAMRQILVDRARRRLSQKRGGDWRQVSLTGVASNDAAQGVLELDEALGSLSKVDAEAADVAQMRTFGGMTVPEVAAALERSESTVARKWRFARVFLLKQMQD